MAEKTSQSLANHTRFDPWFHAFLLPVFGVALVMCLVNFFGHFMHRSVWGNVHAFLLIVLAFAFVVHALKTRLYSLKVQDRVIRLEERLRLMQILPEPLRARIPELTESQLIGLRFASDAELTKLVERTLNDKLSRADIKKSVLNWRPDNWRV